MKNMEQLNYLLPLRGSIHLHTTDVHTPSELYKPCPSNSLQLCPSKIQSKHNEQVSVQVLHCRKRVAHIANYQDNISKKQTELQYIEKKLNGLCCV